MQFSFQLTMVPAQCPNQCPFFVDWFLVFLCLLHQQKWRSHQQLPGYHGSLQQPPAAPLHQLPTPTAAQTAGTADTQFGPAKRTFRAQLAVQGIDVVCLIMEPYH